MAQNINVGMKCVKYMLFVSNFMFVMVGVLLISFGSTIKSIYETFELFMEDHYFSPASLTVAIGVIILLISAFGCAAAIKESTCLVNLYALLLTFVLILEISASIAAYAMRANIEVYMEIKMKDAMKDYSNYKENRDSVDFLQEHLRCCGVHSPEEWFMYNNNHSEFAIPDSCCMIKDQDGDCTTYYENGCLNRLAYLTIESSVMLGTGALCITFVQVLGIAFAVMLAKAIRKLKTDRAAERWNTRQELYLQLARGQDKPTDTPVTYSPSETDA